MSYGEIGKNLIIKESELSLDQLLGNYSEAVVIINSMGEIIYVNTLLKECFGYEKNELLGERIEILIPDSSRDIHTIHRKNYFKIPQIRPKGVGLVFQGKRKNSEIFPVEIILNPIQTSNGEIILAIVRDLSELKKIEQLSKLLNSAKIMMPDLPIEEEYLTGSELSSSLNDIFHSSEILHEDQPDSLHQKYIREISKCPLHLLSMIEDILDYSNVSLGKIKFKHEKSDLKNLINEVVASYNEQIITKEIALNISTDENCPLYLDQYWFKKILSHYLSNAIKFSRNKGIIHINVYAISKGILCLEVQDNGIGIKLEDICKLFIGFQQLDPNISKNYPGIGIGLALIKKIVESQGGFIHVISSPGEGSTFYATIGTSRITETHF